MSVYPDSIRRVIVETQIEKIDGEWNARGTAASFECGCFVRFELSVDDQSQVIRNAAFRSNGCGYMVASAAVLAAYLKWRNLRDLHGLEAKEIEAGIFEHAGDFPTERLQCCEIVVEAVARSFADHRLRQIEEFSGEKALICTCFGVSEDTIEGIIRERQTTEVSEVSAICNAGSGCGSCRMLIQEMIDSRFEQGDMI